MNAKRLLEQVPVDPEAEERAWEVVRAAYARHEPCYLTVNGRLSI